MGLLSQFEVCLRGIPTSVTQEEEDEEAIRAQANEELSNLHPDCMHWGSNVAIGGQMIQLTNAKVVVFKCKVSTQMKHPTFLGQDQSVKLLNLSRKKRAIHLQVGFWKCNTWMTNPESKLIVIHAAFVGLVRHVGDMSLHISRFLEFIVLVCWLYHSPMFGSLRGRSRTQPLVFNAGVVLAGDARRAHLAEAATGRSHKVAIAMFI